MNFHSIAKPSKFRNNLLQKNEIINVINESLFLYRFNKFVFFEYTFQYYSRLRLKFSNSIHTIIMPFSFINIAISYKLLFIYSTQIYISLCHVFYPSSNHHHICPDLLNICIFLFRLNMIKITKLLRIILSIHSPSYSSPLENFNFPFPFFLSYQNCPS